MTSIHSLKTEITVYYSQSLVERAREEAPPALLLALHGWGENSKAFIRPFRSLLAEHISVVAPWPPHQFYLRMAPKKVGFNWLTQYHKENAIADTHAYLNQLLDRIEDRSSFDPHRLFILGFSQGSAMAWRFALNGGRPIAGLISCCADLPEDVEGQLGQAQPFRTLLVHAQDDPLISKEKSEHAVRALGALDWPYERFLFHGGHRINKDVVHAVGQWIKKAPKE